jgi:integrase
VEGSIRRKRGSIRRMGASLQVRVSAGDDPSTGERIVLVEGVPIEKLGNERSERAAMNQAEKVRIRLLAEADSLKVARTKATLAALLDRWLPKHEVDSTTRMNYESQIRNYIKPNLGDVPLLLLVRDVSERLERV